MTTQTPFARWLQEVMDAHNIQGRTDFAEFLGIDQSLVSRWMDSKVKAPGLDNAAIVAGKLGIQPEDVLAAAGKLPPRQSRLPDAQLVSIVVDGNAHPSPGDILPELPDVEVYTVRILGDCLEPVIRPGDYLVMSRIKPARVGDVVAFIMDDSRQVKRVEERNGVLCLVSRHGPLVPMNSVVIEGVMISHLRPVGE